MNYQKIDAALARKLSHVQNEDKAFLTVFVRTKELPGEDEIRVLMRLGVGDIGERRRMFTATLSPQAIKELSEQPWIQYLKLSNRLQLLIMGEE